MNCGEIGTARASVARTSAAEARGSSCKESQISTMGAALGFGSVNLMKSRKGSGQWSVTSGKQTGKTPLARHSSLVTFHSSRERAKYGYGVLGLALLVFSSSLLFGQGPKTSLPQWPPAPEPPRIQFISSYSRARDFGWKRPLWRKVVDWAMNETDPSILQRPFALTFDHEGRLIIADTGASNVKIFDPANKSVKVIHQYKGKQFGAPVAVAVDDEDNIYVSDSGAGRVLKYSAKGKLLGFIGGEEGYFKRPASIAFNPVNHLLYVVDTVRPKVFAFSTDGQMKIHFGERGTEPGQFNFPTFIAIDKTGRLYINDTLNFRIQMFSPEGKFLEQFGSGGDGSGSINRPKGLAIDREGHVYIAEALFSTVQIFDVQGRYLLSFGQSGKGPGEFYIPAGMAFDSSNRIYVADPFQRRVEIFQYFADDAANAPPHVGGGR